MKVHQQVTASYMTWAACLIKRTKGIKKKKKKIPDYRSLLKEDFSRLIRVGTSLKEVKPDFIKRHQLILSLRLLRASALPSLIFLLENKRKPL